MNREQSLEQALKNLIGAADRAGICDDIIAEMYPDSVRNGQPKSRLVKDAQRAMNEARAALALESAPAEFKAIPPEYMERIIQEACDRLGYRILALGELDAETLEAAAKVADRHAGENEAQAKKQMVRAAKIRRIGDPFGHGAMAGEWCAELTAAQHEAQSIAVTIRALGGKQT